MIKVSATVCGTILRDAVVTTNEKGVSTLELTVRVNLPSRSGDTNHIDVVALINDSDHKHLKEYKKGARIVVDGKMTISKADDLYVFVIRDAQPQINYTIPSEDSITGDITFTGKAVKVAQKTDKRGRQFLVLNGASPIKVGTNKWDSVWVNFLRFPTKNSKPEDIFPSWLKEGINVEILGDLVVSSYQNRIGLTSRIMEMMQKEDNTQSNAATAEE